MTRTPDATARGSAESHGGAGPPAKAPLQSDGGHAKILNAITEGVWMADHSDVICYANRAMANISGMPVEEMVGLPVPHGPWPGVSEHFLSCYREAKQSHDPVPYPLMSLAVEQGRERLLSGWLIPLRSGDVLEGVLCTASDVTNGQRAQDELRQSATRLREAQHLARLGYWEWDTADNVLVWSEETYRIFGVDPTEHQVTVEDFEGRIHPDDLPGFLAEREQALAEQRQVEITHRIIRPDGEVRSVHERAMIARDDHGGTARVLGTVQDISERLAREQELRQHHGRLKELLAEHAANLEQANHDLLREIAMRRKVEDQVKESAERFRSYYELGLIGMAILSRDKKWEQVNGRLCEILGRTERELVGKTWADITHPDDLATEVRLFNRVVSGKAEGYKSEKRFIRKDGEIVYAHVSASCLRNPDGGFDRFVALIQDFTERKRDEMLLQDAVKEKDMLLREIHHRVKNNLQVITSLLQLQVAQIQDAPTREIFLASQSRIQSMALVHEALYRSEGLARISLAAYVTNLLGHLRHSIGHKHQTIRIANRVGPLTLDPDQAMPVGLILNELISNALKYAYPDGAGGELQVRIRSCGKGQIEILVADKGIGLPADREIRKRGRLGLELVTGLAERQLHGTVRVNRDHGTEFRIRFPAKQEGRPDEKA